MQTTTMQKTPTTTFKIAVVEDEALIAEKIRYNLKTMGYHNTNHYSSYPTALEAIKANLPDLALLDIELSDPPNGPDGIMLAKAIRQFATLPVIFLTQHPYTKFQDRLQNVPNVAYLRKQFYKDTLHAAIIQAVNNKQSQLQPATNSTEPEAGIYTLNNKFFVYHEGQFQSFEADDLLFIQAARGYSDMVFGQQSPVKKVIVTMNMTKVAQQLGYPQLVQVHRSTTINLHHLTAINGNMLIVGGHEIQMGPKYRDALLNHLRILKNPKT